MNASFASTVLLFSEKKLITLDVYCHTFTVSPVLNSGILSLGFRIMRQLTTNDTQDNSSKTAHMPI
jgi:hypothetical protein